MPKYIKKRRGLRKRYGKRRRMRMSRRSFRRTRRNKVYSKRIKGLVYFPDRLYLKMMYSTFFNSLSAAGTVTHQVYRGNSIYDPDYAIGGLRPYGYTVYSSLYSKYLCYGSKIKISVTNLGGNSTALDIAIIPALDAATIINPIASVADMSGYPYAKVRRCGVDGKSYTLSHYMSTQKIADIHKSALLSDYQFSADYNGNPIGGWFWNIYIDSPDNTKQFNIQVKVKITYYVELYRRIKNSVLPTLVETDGADPGYDQTDDKP